MYYRILHSANICTQCNLLICTHPSHIFKHLGSVTSVLHTPEEVLMWGVDFSHRLPLLWSPFLHTCRQNGHDVVGEVGGAGVGGGQHVDVGEPIRGFSSVPLAHQEDTESQQGREAGLPAEETKWWQFGSIPVCNLVLLLLTTCWLLCFTATTQITPSTTSIWHTEALNKK